ncbi:hypothetical protein D3C74_376780 [compost metagenome]
MYTPIQGVRLVHTNTVMTMPDMIMDIHMHMEITRILMIMVIRRAMHTNTEVMLDIITITAIPMITMLMQDIRMNMVQARPKYCLLVLLPVLCCSQLRSGRRWRAGHSSPYIRSLI